MNKKQKNLLIRIIVAAVFFVPLYLISEGIVKAELPGWALLLLFLVPYLVVGHDILRKALTVFYQLAQRPAKCFLNLVLRQVWSGAALRARFVVLPFPPIFLIAPPDNFPIRIVAVPDLGAVCSATASTKNLPREGTQPVVVAFFTFPSLHLILDKLPFLRINYPRMTIFYIVLRHFPLVFLHFLGKKIYRKHLLKERFAFIFLV